MKKIKLLFIIVLFFIPILLKGESENWFVIEKYSVKDFDRKGNNLYLGEDGYFYVDKIDLKNKELIITRYSKHKELVYVLKTGLFFKETETNNYIRRNEMIAVFVDKRYFYLYYPGNNRVKAYNKMFRFDLDEKIIKKIISLQNIEYESVFGFITDRYIYSEKTSDHGDVSFQIKLIFEGNRFFLDGYYYLSGPEYLFVHDYYIFDKGGKLLDKGYASSFNKHKNIYPVFLKEDGEVIKGVLAEEEMEKLANEIGYTIKEGWTDVYRGFHNSDLYIDKEGKAWISINMFRAGSKMSDDINYESSIYGLIEEDGRWKVKEFINFLNFSELRYNVFIDRILKAEGNKLWLWVRIGHNITEAYEKRYFDREIWVIEKRDYDI